MNLTSNNYKSTIEWNNRLKNKIDTVNVHPMVNRVTDEDILKTVTVDSVIIDGDSAATTLPLDIGRSIGFQHSVCNQYVIGFINHQLTKGCVEIVTAHGQVDIELDKDIVGTPTVEILLNGKSYDVLRKSKNYDDYPSFEDLNTPGKLNLAKWVVENTNNNESSVLKWKYDDGKCYINPWVVNPLNPIRANVLTDWWKQDLSVGSHYFAQTNSWTDNVGERQMGSTPIYKAGVVDIKPPDPAYPDYTYVNDSRLVMNYYYMGIYADVTRDTTNTRKFKVNFYVPVRFAYVCASRERNTITWSELDSYAFVDIINSITINFKGKQYNEEVRDLSFSYRDGALSKNPINNSILDLNAGECFTLDTWALFEVLPWYRVLSRRILTKYQDGKYVVSVDVYARWSIQNNIHINSEMYVILQDGTYIKRKNDICKFKVVNIEKCFSSDEFIYRLKLLEV